MSDEVKTKLESRKAQIEKEFDALKASHSELSKKLSENQARQVQLQGAYQEVINLLNIDSPKKESPVKDKVKK